MIYVDSRERNSGIFQILNDMKLDYKELTLEVADYIVVGNEAVNVGVERKSAGDYVGSLVSGSLNNQLVQMSRSFPFSFLLVEGNITSALMERQTSRSTVFSSLVGSALKRSPDGCSGVVSVIPTDNIWDTALVLKFLDQKLSDPNGLIRLPKLNPTKFSDEENVLCMLMTVPGVGEVIGKEILNHFHTLQAVVNASKEELVGVKNIGEVKAKRIYEFFRLRFKEW